MELLTYFKGNFLDLNPDECASVCTSPTRAASSILDRAIRDADHCRVGGEGSVVCMVA